MKSTILDGLSYWSVYQADRRIDFNGFFWARSSAGAHAAGGLLIDPLPLDDARAAIVEGAGGARWILLTNFDHLRATADLKERFGSTVLAPAGERERFGTHAGVVDTWFASSGDLPDELARDVDVHWLRGGKSAVEAAFYLRPLRALLFGDLVRSHVSGKLQLLPPPKLSDPAAAAASVRPLAELPLAALLLGDGDCVFNGAEALFRSFAKSL